MAAEEIASGPPCRKTKMVVDRLAGRLGDFEATGRPVFCWRTVARSMV